MSGDSINIRKCRLLDEMRACIALQKEVWNFSDADLVPLRVFVVAEKIGGQVVGAFAGNEMAGFALSVPGFRGGHSYLHSHMLAVRNEHQNAGLGRRIKLFQRDDALARGFELIEWTFDPLEIKNAFLNIHKLGAVVCHYRENFYGVSSSRLQGGLPTDRLLAEWYLDSDRVRRILDGSAMAVPHIEERITVPASIYEWKATERDRERALAVQLENRRRFQQAFARGLAVLGFERDAEGNGIFVLGATTQLESGIQTFKEQPTYEN